MLLPFTSRSRQWEPFAMELRCLLRLSLDDLLDPYELAPLVGLKVVDAREVCEELDSFVARQILQTSRDEWSGGVLAQPLPDGSHICILNPTHHERRRKMTLMEEIAHVHLRHIPCKLTSHAGGLRMRDYNKPQEQEAFGVGAAALVPWNSFFAAINGGVSIPELARRYQVSQDLISYRIRITGGSNLYSARQRARQ